LIKGTFVNGEKDRLINIILQGMQGVEIKGEYYANPMPAFDYLSDQDIAEVLTYVRNGFSNSGSAISADDVALARKKE
jgi:mono/diheme cytochrome c family protein